MTNHTDQDAREAREWAEYITSVRELHGDYAPQARAAARFVLANTDSPLPDPLFGARATHPEFGEGVVISHFPDGSGEVRFMFQLDRTHDGTGIVWLNPAALTFHTLDHPESIEAEQEKAVYDLLPGPTLPDPLFGVRATHPNEGEGVVVSHRVAEGSLVHFAFRRDENTDGTRSRWLNPSTLTFHTPTTLIHDMNGL